MYQQGVLLGLGDGIYISNIIAQCSHRAETLERLVAADSPSTHRYQQWADVWEKCVRLEIGFWDNAMSRSEE